MFKSDRVCVRALTVGLLLTSFCRSVAFAATTPQWEINGGSASNLNLSWTGGQSTTTFGVRGGAAYTLAEQLQAAVNAAFLTASSSGSSSTALVLLAGPTFNFGGSRLQDSFGLTAQVGITLASVASTTSTFFTYAFSLEKRFSITDFFSYNPAVGFTGTTSTPATTGFSVVPLSFSLFL